jgi:hypothetical protein
MSYVICHRSNKADKGSNKGSSKGGWSEKGGSTKGGSEKSSEKGGSEKGAGVLSVRDSYEKMLPIVGTLSMAVKPDPTPEPKPTLADNR